MLMKNTLLFTFLFFSFLSCKENQAVSGQMNRAETLLASKATGRQSNGLGSAST